MIDSNVDTTVAARIAGEDIRLGDYVAVLNEIVELPSFLWSGASMFAQREEPVRVRYLPRDAGQPFKVVAICLPFVYTQRPNQKVTAFDTRQQQLVRLDADCGETIWQQMQKPKKK